MPSIISCLNCACVSDPGVFKRCPSKQVQQPMCLHKISWRDLGADLPTVPPLFNSHFTRTTLYIPAPGMPSWECDRQPWRCLHLAQWGCESRRDDQIHWWMPSWSSDPEVVSPACWPGVRCTLVKCLQDRTTPCRWP